MKIPGTPPDQVSPLGPPPPDPPGTPPGTRYTPPEQCMLGDTGNKRAVRILLECILVIYRFMTCLAFVLHEDDRMLSYYFSLHARINSVTITGGVTRCPGGRSARR